MVLAVGHVSIRGARGIPRAPSGPAGDVLPPGNVQSNSSVCASWMPHLWSNFCRLVLLLQLRWFIPFLLYVYLAHTFYGLFPCSWSLSTSRGLLMYPFQLLHLFSCSLVCLLGHLWLLLSLVLCCWWMWVESDSQEQTGRDFLNVSWEILCYFSNWFSISVFNLTSCNLFPLSCLPKAHLTWVRFSLGVGEGLTAH